MKFVVRIDPSRFHVNRAYRAGKTLREGKAIVYQGVKYASAKALLAEQAHLQWDRPPLLEPVDVHICLFFKGAQGDIDGPIKGILDALEDAEVYKSDAQVDGLSVFKFHKSPQPRVEIEVSEWFKRK